jgi:DNA-binding transcriptional LysR family regulator
MKFIPSLEKHNHLPAYYLVETLAIIRNAGSVEKASLATGVPIQTVKERLWSLEERVGEKVFIRNARPFTLTEEGEKLLTYL